MIEDFINKGYTFNHKAEKKLITLANKMDMSYHFYFKHNMLAVDRNLIMMINKDKTLLNKLNRNWRHPLIRRNSNIQFISY